MTYYERKKIIGLLIILLVLCGCVKEKIKEEISYSSKYSKIEIQKAMDTVKKESDKTLNGSKLTLLAYDEDESNGIIEDYLPTSDTLKKVKSDNIIVLYSEIKTSYFSGSLDPMSNYKYFYWILSKGNEWEIQYSGFLN